MSHIPAKPRPIVLSNQYNLVFAGTRKDYFRTWLPLAVLTLATGGVGWFWLNSARKRYLLPQISFLTVPFGYHGTGLGELLQVLPWMVLSVVLTVSSQFLNGADHRMSVAALAGSVIVWLFTIPTAWHRHHRYVINHITWAGQPVQHSGSTLVYVAHWGSGLFLTILSLGFYAPYWRNRLFALQYDNICCGDWALLYTGQARDLLEDYISAVPATIVSGGAFYAWLASKVTRYRTANLWIGGRGIGSARGFDGFKGEDYLIGWIFAALTVPLSLGLTIPLLTINRVHARIGKFAFIGNLNMMKAVDAYLQAEDQKQARRSPSDEKEEAV